MQKHTAARVALRALTGDAAPAPAHAGQKLSFGAAGKTCAASTAHTHSVTAFAAM